MTSVRTTSPDTLLRIVLRINATTSGLGGVVAAAAPARLDDVLGTGRPEWVRVLGVGLVLFAVSVAAISTVATEHLRRVVPWISSGDGSWVIASVVAVALGWFSTGGAVIVGGVALMVGSFAVEQMWFVRRLGGTGGRVVSAATQPVR